jgi:CRISPR system Cascade subunit CasE
MYLTKITLPNSEAAQRHLFDPYQWHVALWKCFQAKERPYVFRVDQGRDQTIFLMLSPVQPAVQAWGVWETRIIPERFYAHNKYLFSLRAYPAVKKAAFEKDGTRKKQGIRVPRPDPEEWLKGKAVENGFELERVAVTKKHSQTASKGFQMAVDFEGVLTVKNKNLFLNAVAKGIGPSKAYGLGLLLLKPY